MTVGHYDAKAAYLNGELKESIDIWTNQKVMFYQEKNTWFANSIRVSTG